MEYVGDNGLPWSHPLCDSSILVGGGRIHSALNDWFLTDKAFCGMEKKKKKSLVSKAWELHLARRQKMYLLSMTKLRGQKGCGIV